MHSATLTEEPGSLRAYEQQEALPVEVSALSPMADEASADQRTAARGILVGAALAAVLWAAIIGFVITLHH